MAEAPSSLRIVLSQPVKEHAPVHATSHVDRDRIIEVFRNAIVRIGSPENFALQVVQEAVRPQKQTVLILDENQSLENALRMLLQDLVSAAVKSGERTMQYGQPIDNEQTNCAYIPRLLDIVLYLCERGHIEGGMIFQLLEDLTEMSTMRDCKQVFGYIESKQDTLGKQELFGRGKLVMLRTCNQLLRRLSKANDVVFCGRILMFLAHFFPLSERSAVNFKGVFNISNETKYEKDASNGVSIDFDFYKTFWSLQDHFRNPAATTLPPAKWQKFSSNLMVVLDAFEAQPLTDDGGIVNNLEHEEASFNIKYLTSSKLMGLELKDPSFRRHILVQCLILFDYLKVLTAGLETSKTAITRFIAPAKSEKDCPSDSMKDEIKSCEQRVKRLLESTPPKGKEFLQSIEHILERENNWLWWKWDGCPPFEKQPLEKKTGQDGAKKRKPRWRLGNKELSQLWKWAEQNPNALSDPQRVRMPSVAEYWKPLAEDMDPAAGIEEEYHHKNNRATKLEAFEAKAQAFGGEMQVYCWKGLRFSARQDLEGFSKFAEYGVEGVVPPELLPPEVRSKFHAKSSEKNKRAKKEEESKNTATQPEDNHLFQAAATGGVDADGGGSGAEMDDGAAPMDSDAVTVASSLGGIASPEEGEKQSPDIITSQEAGQSEAEGEVEADVKETNKHEILLS